MNYTETTPDLLELSRLCKQNDTIDTELFARYDVKRGLRNNIGQGVLAGLTEIAEVSSYYIEEGDYIPCEGRLYYRGIEIRDLVNGFSSEKRTGFEEITYLLLFGQLPTAEQLQKFKKLLADYRTLPSSFVRDIIMKAPSNDMMNTLARSVLTLYSYDDRADECSVENVLRQCLQLIALFPLWSVYGYQAYSHYYEGQSLFIHNPEPDFSTAANILHMLRADSKFTKLEEIILDMCLVLHMEHGGGNNSTFTTHVVSSTGTDTYSVMAAAIGSLKGPKHGGANIKVMRMFDDIKANVHDWKDEDEVAAYLTAILEKRAFDNSGLIYGIGHAVYSLSDPRAELLKSFVEKLSVEKGLTDEYALYDAVARLSPQLISAKRKMYKGVSANVDFYSGFVYSMLGLPTELYTPIFAIARIVGWSAHRIEGIINDAKIIRPAFKSVAKRHPYTLMDER